MIKTDWQGGQLIGEDPSILRSTRTVGDLMPYWHDQLAAEAMKDAPVYRTESYFPAPDGTVGAVLWASTVLYPGVVGQEYFMTRGHFHVRPTHGELIVVASGSGVLLLMDRSRACSEVALGPGVTFAIDGRLAHRTVNTGTEPLVFWCSWPADCGHDYDEITQSGFSKRIMTGSTSPDANPTAT